MLGNYRNLLYFPVYLPIDYEPFFVFCILLLFFFSGVFEGFLFAFSFCLAKKSFKFVPTPGFEDTPRAVSSFSVLCTLSTQLLSDCFWRLVGVHDAEGVVSFTVPGSSLSILWASSEPCTSSECGVSLPCWLIPSPRGSAGLLWCPSRVLQVCCYQGSVLDWPLLCPPQIDRWPILKMLAIF